MLNCAVVMGRLTTDPELKKTPSGVSVVRFSVAVDRGYAKQGEERKADFINVVAWRNTAEFVCKYFSKGSMIAVQGAIETSKYEKNGYTFYSWEIKADNVSFCGSKNEVAIANNATPTPQPSSFQPMNDDTLCQMADDDDLPF